MLKLTEVIHLIIAILLFAFVINFLEGNFLPALIAAFIIIAVNVAAKKLMAFRLDSEVTHKIWHLQRWGYYERSYFKKPIPLGIILPFLLVWISYPIGFLKVLTFIQSDIKPTPLRVTRRRGSIRQRYSAMTEWHLSLIAGMGILATAILGILAYLFNLPLLAGFSAYYSIWNLLPISQIDGCKIFFGSKIFWIFLTIISLIESLIFFIII